MRLHPPPPSFVSRSILARRVPQCNRKRIRPRCLHTRILARSTPSRSLLLLRPHHQFPAVRSHPYSTTQAPASLSQEEYHALSDAYISHLLAILEDLAEGSPGDEEVEVEYAAGVLTLTLPGKGTYVLNKQPPNRQIWLSSPVSGPKRYDFVQTSGGSSDAVESGSGQWMYLRDGSTLDGLLEEEIGIDLRTEAGQ